MDNPCTKRTQLFFFLFATAFRYWPFITCKLVQSLPGNMFIRFWSMSCMLLFIWTNTINDASRLRKKVNTCKKIFGQQPCRHRSLRLPSYHLRGVVLAFQPWRVAAVIDGAYPFLSTVFVKNATPLRKQPPPSMINSRTAALPCTHGLWVSAARKSGRKKLKLPNFKPTPAKRTIKKN